MPENVTPPSHKDLADKMEGRYTPPIASVAPPAEKAPVAEPNPAEPPAQAAPPADPGTAPAEKASGTVNLDELSDEDFLKLYEKRVGVKAKSLDELKPAPQPLSKEEQEALEAKEVNESLEWAFATEKIKKDFYDKAVVARSKDKRAIALELFSADLMAEDEDLTVEDCEERFKEFYCEEEPESSWRRKKATAQMNAVADTYLSQFSDIDNITPQYRDYKSAVEKQKAYNKQVSAVAKELPKDVSFKIPYVSVDGAKSELEYKVPVDESVIPKLVKEFTADGMEGAFGDNPKPEAIASELTYHIRARMIEKAIPVIMAKHAEKVEEDIMMKLKNARNPYQPIGGQVAGTAAPKTPPSHEDVLKRIK